MLTAQTVSLFVACLSGSWIAVTLAAAIILNRGGNNVE